MERANHETENKSSSHYKFIIAKVSSFNGIIFANTDVADKLLSLSKDPPLYSLYISLLNQIKYRKYPNLENIYTIQQFNESPAYVDFSVNQSNTELIIKNTLHNNLLRGISLEEALYKRRSSRKFKGSLSLQKLYIILYYTFQKTHYVEIDSKKKDSRMYPSPGALYPNRLYLISLNVDELVKGGIYYYDPNNSSLILLGKRDITQIEKAFIEPDLISTVSTILVIVTDMSMIYAKYGELGFKLALIEAGSILYLITLIASSLDIPNLPYESFYNYDICDLLGINCVDQFPATTILMG
ncbi:SagB/ThcOx family dehydrogenase [Sulfolobus sp. S-194]|uniref:SagB/ThcOx family dehydrogenase n=1 Tax=Sulfolobus sp. S-194 TaxID=2512240 RepID=UPI00143713D5|nr:SagB/ThcOx family dehydrogenase [Sulfolobus sp. S-194]QIW23868.1 SagB/ThcOx family dehydrogenase [Sulfolobus sp. S-194]